MFLEPDERVIIMEDWYNPFSLDDLHKLEDAGVKTIYVTHPFCWDKMQASPLASLDFSSPDARIERLLKSNMKLMLPVYHTMPTWFPSEWYIKRDYAKADGNIPNYGNHDFQMAVDGFIDGILDHYKDAKERVQLTYAIPAGGEFLWDAVLKSNFPSTDAEIAEFVIGRQRKFVKQFGEIWTLFHNFLGDPLNWNNTRLPLLYQALVDAFPNIPFYSIQGAHFTCGGLENYKEGQYKVKEYSEKFGIKFFVGSDYCEGMVRNYDEAQKQGAYGYITAPLHFEHPKQYKKIEDWMVETIKQTIKRFNDDSD